MSVDDVDEEHILFACEVAVERPSGDIDAVGDLLDCRGVKALGREQVKRLRYGHVHRVARTFRSRRPMMLRPS